MSPRLHGYDASTRELNQSFPHRRTNHLATQFPWRTHHPGLTGELIILLHNRHGEHII